MYSSNHSQIPFPKSTPQEYFPKVFPKRIFQKHSQKAFPKSIPQNHPQRETIPPRNHSPKPFPEIIPRTHSKKPFPETIPKHIPRFISHSLPHLQRVRKNSVFIDKVKGVEGNLYPPNLCIRKRTIGKVVETVGLRTMVNPPSLYRCIRN